MTFNKLILPMTILSVWSLRHSTPEDRLNAVINDLTQVATDYTAIKDFHDQQPAYNTIATYERTVEAHLRATIRDAAAYASLNGTESKSIMDGLAQPYPEFMRDLLEGITNRLCHAVSLSG